MKPQNSRANDSNSYRQSMSILASELIRHSFSGDAQAPPIYR